VYSEPDQGTSFKVYFPRVSDEAPIITGVDAPQLVGGTEVVLVVEDDALVRRMATNMLERMGYSVLVASTGNEALEVAEGHEGVIHLLLTDVVMPLMNGRELAGRILETRPEIKVLYTSGYTQNVIAHHGVLDEGVQFVAKPYSVATLSARVREVLDSD